MAIKHPIKPSNIPYENTGTLTAMGRQFKIIGFDINTNQAIVKNDRSEYRLMTNHEIAKLAATP